MSKFELANSEIKNILMKVVETNRKDWVLKLVDALWGYIITFKTILGMSPYLFVVGNTCHIPLSLNTRHDGPKRRSILTSKELDSKDSLT